MKRASRKREAAAIAERLRERRSDLEQAILARVYAVSKPPLRGGPEYVEGLRAAVAAGINYGLGGIEHGERVAQPIPDALLAQARLAARSGVSLDTVLRRYFAGHVLLEDFMVQEAERAGQLDPAELKLLLRSQAAIVDRLLAAVSEAYAEEAERRLGSAARRRAERIERLLAGELLDSSDLGYELEAHHLGLIASGSGAEQALVDLARLLDARLLALPREDGAHWAWLGWRRKIDPTDLFEGPGFQSLPSGLTLAVGEPGEGAAGWRLSHRQARAAFAIALRRSEPAIVRYGDVALLASVLQDDLLATSLRQLYLEPLERERDGGAALRETLRAYFEAGRNVSSAAAALGVNRNTVAARLRAVEECIDRPLSECGGDLEVALRLEEGTSPLPLTGQLAEFSGSH